MFIMVPAFIVVAANPFLYCFFGKITTDRYAKMADHLFEINWYKLPIKLQKYLILMIANMQRPLYFDGFGICKLDLGMFQTVRIVYFECIHLAYA